MFDKYCNMLYAKVYGVNMITIRKYQEEDREKVRDICKDTAKGSFAIKPKKREAVAMMYIDYNIDYEPENALVAVDENDNVCGYCVYSCDMEKLKNVTNKIIAKNVAKINPFYALFLKGCVNTSIKLSKEFSGGGFHINIDSNHQGQHIGPMLLQAMAKHLKSKGYKYMYLVTENRKTRGYGFYMHFGFKEARRCALGTLCLTYDLSKIE